MIYRLTPSFKTLTGLMLGALLFAATPVSPAWAMEEMSAGASTGEQAIETTAPAAHAAMDAQDILPPAAEELLHETEEDIGFPQLKPDSYPSQIFWLIVTFTLLYTLMSKVALPKVGSVLEMRAAQREANLKRAEEMHDEAATVKTAFEETLAKAHDSAATALKSAEEDIAAKVAAENAKFGEHARNRILSSEQSIQKAKQDALTSLADISAEIAAEMVNKITGAQLTKADAKKAVTTEMQKG